ncbi:HNH endonuclease [Labilibacter sediminis]|nr:HNH endonuclease [Labilibacter sediminis]
MKKYGQPKNKKSGWSWVDEQYKENREKKYTKVSLTGFYNSKQWVDLRNYKLQQNPLCEHCNILTGRLTPAVMVDHIEAIQSEVDPLALDYDNLQSLCDYHHRRKTRLDNSKYNPKNLKKGKEIQKDLDSW